MILKTLRVYENGEGEVEKKYQFYAVLVGNNAKNYVALKGLNDARNYRSRNRIFGVPTIAAQWPTTLVRCGEKLLDGATGLVGHTVYSGGARRGPRIGITPGELPLRVLRVYVKY